MINRNLIDAPWLVKVELSRGCNLRCGFCPVATDTKFQAPYSFIDLGLVSDISRQLSTWVPKVRMEFTLRGEPTLHPDAPEVMRRLREHLPLAQLSMFTNGTGWIKDHSLAQRLFDNGLNLLNVDCYNGTYDKFHSLAQTCFSESTTVEIHDFRDLNGYSRLPRGHKRRILILVPDIALGEVAIRTFENVGGNLTPEQESKYNLTREGLPLQKNCVRPYREVVIHSDGNLALCCVDWNQETVLGTVSEGLENVWYGEKHLDILRALYALRRTGVCAKCDYNGGFRIGLLRDPNTGWSPMDWNK